MFGFLFALVVVVIVAVSRLSKKKVGKKPLVPPATPPAGTASRSYRPSWLGWNKETTEAGIWVVFGIVILAALKAAQVLPAVFSWQMFLLAVTLVTLIVAYTTIKRLRVAGWILVIVCVCLLSSSDTKVGTKTWIKSFSEPTSKPTTTSLARTTETRIAPVNGYSETIYATPGRLATIWPEGRVEMVSNTGKFVTFPGDTSCLGDIGNFFVFRSLTGKPVRVTVNW